MPATTKPPPNLAKELATLERMTATELRDRYAEVFGEPAASGNRVWLARRVGWRLQALAEGDLSERTRAWAAELARDADLRLSPPREPAEPAARPAAAPVAAVLDPRLPGVGTVLTRRYKGANVRVKVQPDGFEYAGDRYGSLSAVAKAVTGIHTNGFLFFRLRRTGVPRESPDDPRPARRGPAGAVCGVHPEVDGGGTRPGVQLARRPAGRGRGVRPEPVGGGVGGPARPVRRRRVHRRQHRPPRPPPAWPTYRPG